MQMQATGSKTMCKTPLTFQGQHLSLIVCLYLAYSKLLKLMVASNAGDARINRDSRRISGFGIGHCWIVACDQHLDGPV